MKRVASIAILIERVRKIAPGMGGVFSYGDLSNLIGAGSKQRNERAIKGLIREGVLYKIQRGIYTTKNPDLWVLGSRLQKNAYVSMDSILAKNLLIGTIPERSASFVYPGIGRRVIETPFGILRFFSSQKSLLFGFSRLPNGVSVADSEKATLDILYYFMRGASFVVDPLNEISLRKLDRPKIEKYLKKYRNARFVAFVKGRLSK